MTDNKILYALEDYCLYLKMIGSIRHTLCANLDSMIRQAIEESQVDRFVVDLKEATFLDSTSLGIIARMARHMQLKSTEKPVLISTNHDVNQILNSVQFNTIADMVEEWDYLPNKFFESAVFARQIRPHHEIILESHRELTQIHENNRNKFAAVIESLEKKYEKKDN